MASAFEMSTFKGLYKAKINKKPNCFPKKVKPPKNNPHHLWPLYINNNITCSISLGLRSDRSSYSSVIALTLKVARPRDASLPENPEYGPPK